MNRDFLTRLRERLLNSEYTTPKTANRNGNLSNLICPCCDNKTAWAYSDRPFSINCNNLEKCGERTKTLSLFPDLLTRVERDYPATIEDPVRPARIYLESRGLSQSLTGLEYIYSKFTRQNCGGGVAFRLSNGGTNARIFNPPTGEGKTHNQDSTGGAWWCHNALTHDKEKRVFITEGIIDALSLIELGEQAISVLSVGQSPDKYIDLLSGYRQIVIAFDNEGSGYRGAWKWYQALTESFDIDHQVEQYELRESTPVELSSSELLIEIISHYQKQGLLFKPGKTKSGLYSNRERLPKRLRILKQSQINDVVLDLLAENKLEKNDDGFLTAPGCEINAELNGLLIQFPETITPEPVKPKKVDYHDERVIMVFPENCKDWNDYLQKFDDGKEARENFRNDWPVFVNNGLLIRLLQAENYQAYITLFRKIKGYPVGIFENDGNTFYASTRTRKENGAEVVIDVFKKVADFTVKCEYSDYDNSDIRKPKHVFHLVLKPRKKRAKSFDCEAKELSNVKYLRELFMTAGGELWAYHHESADALVKKITRGKAPELRTAKTIGLDHDTGAFIFPTFSITKKGELISIEKDGYYKLSARNYVRPANFSDIPFLKPEPGLSFKEIHGKIYEAWGCRGTAALAWWVSSWFFSDIMEKINYFPFLSLWGDPQSGKSTLLLLLNRMNGIDSEGVPLNRRNTEKGILRKISQRSNIALPLIEDNGEKERGKLDMDFLKPAYNGNTLYVRAEKDNTNRTNAIDIPCSIAFCQNAEPFDNQAVKERVISIKFETTELNDITSAAADRIQELTSPRKIANAFPEIMQHRQEFIGQWYDEFMKAREDAYAILGDRRISGNHALLITFNRLLCRIMGLPCDVCKETDEFIDNLAALKVESANAAKADITQSFFNLALVDNWPFVTISSYGLAINLEKMTGILKDHGINVQYETLQKALKNHPAYKEHNRATWFGELGKSLRAWIFDAEKIKEKYDPESMN